MFAYNPEIFVASKNLETRFLELEKRYHLGDIRFLKELTTSISWKLSIPEIIENIPNPTVRLKIRQNQKAILRERFVRNLEGLRMNKNLYNYQDLEKMIFLVSSIGYPESDFSEFSFEINSICNRIQNLFQIIEKSSTDEMKVEIISRVVNEEFKFKGNKSDYDNPDNSYISKILKTRLGNPILLSSFYLIIGNRLGLPFYGINMPLHFLVYFESQNFKTYIDPFHGGVLLNQKICNKFLILNGFNPKDVYFSKASTFSIVKRICKNLLHIYQKENNFEMKETFQKFLTILEPAPS